MYSSSHPVPTQFEDYKQGSSDGACELYAMIFGFMHTSMRDEFEEQIKEDEDGNVTIFFKYFNQAIKVNYKEIQAVLTKKEAAKLAKKDEAKEEIVEYHPSFHPTLIAIGLAYEKAMHLLQQKKLSKTNKELLGKNGYGQKLGYAVTHKDYYDLNKKPGRVADLILKKEVDYLSMDAELILGTDGSICIVNNNTKKICTKPASEVFIICPEGNHAVLYYYDYKAKSWYQFNNQTDNLVRLNENFKLRALGSNEPIRMVYNTEFNEPALVYKKTEIPLIKYYSYVEANGTCYDGTLHFYLSQKPKRNYPDEYLIASILNKYLSSQSSRIQASAKKIIVLTEEWTGIEGRDGGKNTEALNEKIIAAINEAKATQGDTETLILVPFLYGYHHPGIAIQVKNNSSKPEVTAIYLDPFGRSSSKYSETKNLRDMLKREGYAFKEVGIKQQQEGDGTSCGPILTSSMIKFIEEFLAYGEITVNDFEQPRMNLATDRLFQMYIQNTQAVEEGRLGINEIMLADASLWESVLYEQKLKDIPKVKILWLVSKQKEFIQCLKISDFNDPLHRQKIQAICDFQSQLTELIFTKPYNIKNKINLLIGKGNQILNDKPGSDLFFQKPEINLLNSPYLEHVHKKLRINAVLNSANDTLEPEEPKAPQKQSSSLLDLSATDSDEVRISKPSPVLSDNEFERIKEKLIASKPFNDLIAHMARSTKWRQINAYLVAINQLAPEKDYLQQFKMILKM